MNRCAVALALVEKGFEQVSVSNYSFAYTYEGERWVGFPLPVKMEEFIREYDRNKKNVGPESFVVEVLKVGVRT